MAKRDQMLRLMHISNFLKSKPNGANYEEISIHLEELHYKESYDNDLAFSEKTFKRDRDLLLELFGIEIKFKRRTMTYQILNDEFSENSQTIFDNLLLVNAYKQTVDNSEIMIFEKRQASGLHNLEGIVYAIKNGKIISFKYTKHWEGIPNEKVAEPYALKEFRNRWYLLANECQNGKDFFLKTFGLDRISDLGFHDNFKRTDADIEKMFTNSFGIISTLDETPQEIILSFTAFQGKYVKSLPLHHSQEILIDNSEELRIKLTLVPTFDFKQEILSIGENVKIISPENFRNDFKNEIKKMLKNF